MGENQMKLIYKDLKHGEIKLIPENLDDIWHLYNLIDKGDLVRSITYRSIEQQDDKIRSKKSEKKRVKLGIEVQELEFHEFSNRLRIHGIIMEGPQDLGSFHTLNISTDKMDKISIIKKKWQYYHINRIDEAIKNQNQEILTFLSLDDETATIAVLRQSGIQLVAEIKSNRSGKMYDSINNDNEYFGDILSTIIRNKNKKSPLIIIGPGFVKEHFLKFFKEKNVDKSSEIFTQGTGNSGLNGINEAIKSGIVNQIAKHHRVVFETQIIEKLFEEIKKNGLVTYGENNISFCLKNGAVDRLLITDTMVRTKKGEEILTLSKKCNSDFTIINTIHEAGKKLDALGGFAAFLRFKV
jgi:protein pelota